MHTKFFFILFMLLTSSVTFSQQITINQKETKVTFVFLDQDVRGELRDFMFTGNIDLAAIETSTLSGTVATETLDTNNWLRSRHLRSKKYFHAKAHPTLSFKSNTIQSIDGGFRVSGSLTIKGITKDVVWDFSINESSLEGTTSINTQDYSINIYDERERNNVNIEIVFPYTK